MYIINKNNDNEYNLKKENTQVIRPKEAYKNALFGFSVSIYKFFLLVGAPSNNVIPFQNLPSTSSLITGTVTLFKLDEDTEL